MTAKFRSIRLGFAPGKGSRNFGLKMDKINKFEDIIALYQKKNGENISSLNKFIEINLDSNSLFNKSLDVCGSLKSVKTPTHNIEDVQDMEEKVYRGDFFVLFIIRNDIRVTGAELKLMMIINDDDYFLLFFFYISYNNNSYKDYDIYYCNCKCLLPFQNPVTDNLICVGLSLTGDNIIFS